MSNSTARLAGILRQVKPRRSAARPRGCGASAPTAGGTICFLLALGAAACTSVSSSPGATSGGQTGSGGSQTGGSSGTGGAAPTGGSSSVASQGGTAISSGTGGAASGGAGGINQSGGAGSGGVVGSGGAGSGGVVGSGGAALTGGTTAQGGSSSTGGVGGRGGSSGSGGATRTGGANAGGTTSQGGATGGSGGSATDAGAAGQGGGDAGTTTLAADSLAVRFANAVMARWPNPTDIYTKYGYEYNDGIVLRGIEQVYRHTLDAKYLTYLQKYFDAYVSSSGVVTLPDTAHSFDNIQPSVMLPFLYQQTGSAKYKTAADNIRARYDTIPRNADKGFWHKQSCPNQMWLDSIYMGEPFLARYGAVFGTCTPFCADTVVEQILLIAQHLRDTTTGLLAHAWDDSPTGKQSWANSTTGNSCCVWGRALGWYAMALVDTLGDLPANQTGRSDMLTILTSLAAGLKANQDSKTGLWYQVVDQGSKSDNWVETSASGMFVYALKVAVNRGYIDSSYSAVADKGWTGLQTKVTTDSIGPVINGAVPGMGVQTSYSGYVGQSQGSNTAHGLCSILLAAAEMEAR